MITLTIKTPHMNEEFRVMWESQKAVPALKTDEAKSEWSYLVSRGLYGKYGHAVSLSNCRFTDLVIAIGVLVGEGSYHVNALGREQIAKETEEENRQPIPEGAVS